MNLSNRSRSDKKLFSGERRWYENILLYIIRMNYLFTIVSHISINKHALLVLI
jgi:hypothetical protein